MQNEFKFHDYYHTEPLPMQNEYTLNQILEIRNYKNLILVVGESGTGKSSLINHLVGKEVAKVSHTNIGTKNICGYDLSDNIIICDTVGTNEINDANDKTWQELYKNICELNPDLILLCLDGSKRDNIDSLFKKLEDYLEKAFKEHRIEPQLGIIVNKMDLLEPIGSDNMPENWPNLRTEKGENINEKLKQINNITYLILKSKVKLVEPTYLEWCGENIIKPWNLDNIKYSLINSCSQTPVQKLDSLVIYPDDYESLLTAQVNLTHADMITNYEDNKKNWLDSFIEIKDYKHKDITLFKNYWLDIFSKSTNNTRKKIIKDEILSYIPYFQSIKDKNNVTPKNFNPGDFNNNTLKNFFKVFYDIELDNWNNTFNSYFKTIENAAIFSSNWFDNCISNKGSLLKKEEEIFENSNKIILLAFYPIFFAYIDKNIKLFLNRFSISENYLIATKLFSLFNYLLEDIKNKELIYFIENRISQFKYRLGTIILKKEASDKRNKINDIYSLLISKMTEARKKKNILFYRENK